MAQFKDKEIKWVIKNWVGKICSKHKNWIDQIPEDVLKIITGCVGAKFGEDVNDVLSDLTPPELEKGDEIYVALVHTILQRQKEVKE